jgi:hypothetical protein
MIRLHWKWLVFYVGVILFGVTVGSAISQTRVEREIAVLKARIDSIRASENAKGAFASRVFVKSVADTMPALAAAGVRVVADVRDGQWVQIDLPLSTATGFEKQFWVEWLDASGRLPGLDKNFKPVTGRVRMRKDKAVEALIALNARLK